MPQVPILGGAYKSRATIASAQKCINLFPEENEDKQAPAPVTHFPTPGLVRSATPPAEGPGRCLYTTTRGHLIEVINDSVYYIDMAGNYRLLGNIPGGTTPVIMADNGLAVLLVDGSSRGWAINLSDLAFAEINDPIFKGGSHVAFVDGFFILNFPTFANAWYVSLLYVTFGNLTQHVATSTSPIVVYAFDDLDFATKTGATDPIVGVACCHRNVWLVGAFNTEVWYNTGSADFVFSVIPGVYVEHGTVAPYSIAVQDLTVFWLTRDRYGNGIIVEGDASFQVKQISSRGLEAIFATFTVISDAVAAVYNILGHFYYVISFPTARRTFQYEQKTGEWNELAYTGPNGLERYRGVFWQQAYGKVFCCDYANGRIYRVDPLTFTDDGAPITRVRTIPHLLNEGKRFTLDRVIADLQGGTLGGNLAPKVFLRVSHDRGGSYSDAIEAEFGDTGDYAGLPFWSNLGVARDIVLELSWSSPINTALNGLFIEVTPASW